MCLRILSLLIVLTGFLGQLRAQSYNLGVPIIQNFPKDFTEMGAQNWGIAQDERGVMYFANNDGMISFDGTHWNSYPLPNRTIVRSVNIDQQGYIYVGGQNEFGRFVPNEQGEWTFESLRDLMPEGYERFEDVWQIQVIDAGIFFRSSGNLFRFFQNKISVYPEETIQYLGMAGNTVYAQSETNGLFYFGNNGLNRIEDSEIFDGKHISGLSKIGNTLFIATSENGFYRITPGGILPWKTDADAFFKEKHIISLAKIAGNRFAIGTDFGGLLILSEEGKSIYHLDLNTGLLNNKVLSLFMDKSRNLWLGLANGINYVQVNSPFTRIFPDGELEGSGYDVKIHQGKIYFGTNNGLYYCDWKSHYSPFEKSDFQLVENTKGQTWGLDIVGKDLLLGHNKGAFLIENDKAIPLFSEIGVWNFQALEQKSNQMLVGTYTDVLLFEKEGNWIYKTNISEFNESSRFVEQDQLGNIWMGHPYRGLFEIKGNEDFSSSEYERYGEKNSLPSDHNNHLFKLRNEIVFCGNSGIYSFVPEEKRFQAYEEFNAIFGVETKTRRLVETPEKDIWFINEDHFGLLEIEEKGLSSEIQKRVFRDWKKQLNSGFEAIYPYDENNVFITHDKGFLHYNPLGFQSVDSFFSVVLNAVQFNTDTDSLISGGLYAENGQVQFEQSEEQIPSFAHDQNGILFSFSCTDFVNREGIAYHYRLKGFETDWSEWTAYNTKEYTNLSPGEYTFELQAHNSELVESDILTYRFRIISPWYRRTWAYVLFFLLGSLILLAIIQNYRKKFVGLKEDHEETVKQSAREIDKLKAEKTKAELAYKERELVSATMHLVKKKETFDLIKSRLKEIKKMASNDKVSKEILQVIKVLQQEETRDEGWEQVMFHFNQLHSEFFSRLKTTYPSLTPKDLKMCAYLQMNLSTKEMASLMNVTIRGIEASRYRLRKKFGLDKDHNLTEFLMAF